ncbi:MAG: trypsin [Cenarchaeum symbiont of Oopsacas minuta]|nr:trypsin [Cenarchaeum symbiont of Oopsacas minuta]
MEKASMLLGGAFGAIAVVAVFAIFIFPPHGIQTDFHQQNLMIESVTASSNTSILGLEELFVKSESGTVSIENKQSSDMFGIGSGFVYDSQGHIITNEHVVDDSNKLVVTFLDGRSYMAEIVGTDEYTDIAVLHVNTIDDILTPLQLGDSSQLKVGQAIAAIGNPFGLSGSMTAGIVSQRGRLLPAGDTPFQIPDVIQTDAVVNPGNSGGPLLNMYGHVIGMNTAIQSNTGVFAGVGFAVPSQTIAKIVPYLIRDGEYRHPWIGVSGIDINLDLAEIIGLDDTRGFLVITVSKDSPAEKSGLRGHDMIKTVDGRDYSLGGDIILTIDGMNVRSIDDILVYLQRSKSVDDSIVLGILRDGQKTELTLTLEQRPDN